MKNPNLACDIFKILLAEYVACERVKDTNKTQEIDGLITQSFQLSDQFIARVEADPDIIAAKNKQQGIASAQHASPDPIPQPVPSPDKPDPKK